MRSACLIFVALIGLRATPIPAENETLMDSGNAFDRACSSMATKSKEEMSEIELLHAMACTSYVKGLSDGINLELGLLDAEGKTQVPEPYCSKGTDGIEQVQKVRVVLKYIRNNPEKAHLPTSVLFAFAMHEAFPPCPDKK
jgi:hypothetical protein